MRALPRMDESWWRTNSFNGRPMQDLLAEHDIAALFRFLRSRGWSRAAIAAATGLTETRVRAVSQGLQQITSYEVFERIAAGLGIPRGHLGLAYDVGIPPLQDPTAIRGDGHETADMRQVRSGRARTVTVEMVEEREAVTDTYRRIDYRSGAPEVVADIVTHLGDLQGLTRLPHDCHVQAGLLAAVGDAAQLTAWLHIDMQHYEQARGYCDLALASAREANSPGLRAYVLGMIAYIHLHAGDGAAALRVLTEAVDIATDLSVPVAVGSWLGEAVGEAYGYLGDSRAGQRALAGAERRFDAVSVENTPGYLSFYNADCHAARLKGRCLMRLRQPGLAAAALREALTMLPGAFVRERSGTLIDLAFTYAQMNEIDQACHAASQAYALAVRTQSGRNRKRLNELLIVLMPHTSRTAVQDLYHQLLVN